MRARLVFLLGALMVASCGPTRIKKLEVPRGDMLASYRLMSEGDELLREKKDHLALIKYLEAARLNPYQEVIFNKLAIAYSRLQQFYRARRAVNRAIGLKPDYSFAYNTLGILHLADNAGKKAISSFRKAIDLRSTEANFYVNLGHAYLRERKYEEGFAAYRKALELDPEIFSRQEVIDLPYQTVEGPDPERLYQTARIFAQLEDKDNCLSYLGKALSAGFSDGQRLMGDFAFEWLQQDPEFRDLVNLYGLDPNGS